jgi:hypothetical protein
LQSLLFTSPFIFIIPVAADFVEVLLSEIVFENDEDTVHLIGTPPLATPEQPEE